MSPPPPSAGERRVGHPEARGGRPGRNRRTALEVKVPSGGPGPGLLLLFAAGQRTQERPPPPNPLAVGCADASSLRRALGERAARRGTGRGEGEQGPAGVRPREPGPRLERWVSERVRARRGGGNSAWRRRGPERRRTARLGRRPAREPAGREAGRESSKAEAFGRRPELAPPAARPAKATRLDETLGVRRQRATCATATPLTGAGRQAGNR